MSKSIGTIREQQAVLEEETAIADEGNIPSYGEVKSGLHRCAVKLCESDPKYAYLLQGCLNCTPHAIEEKLRDDAEVIQGLKRERRSLLERNHEMMNMLSAGVDLPEPWGDDESAGT